MGGGEIIGVCMGAAALIIASVPVIKLLGWWFDGLIDGAPAVAGIFLYVVLIASVIAAPSALKVVILLALLASAVAMPVLGQISQDLQNSQLEDNRLRQYALALERNAHDPVPRVALAEALHKRGETDQAIEHMTWVLQQFPKLAVYHAAQLESWRREKLRETQPDVIICHMCHAENDAAAVLCTECGAMFGTRSGMVQRIWREGGPKTVARAWVVLGTTLTVVSFLVTYLPRLLPIEVTGVLVLATVIVGGWLFLRWVGGDIGRPMD
jgi:hypothetical protein